MTARSSNERIRRKLRIKKSKPSTEKDFDGRIVSKKHSNPDPERKHRIAKEFVEFYKGNKTEKREEFPVIIENLISIAAENAGQCKLPYTIERLMQLKEYFNCK
jgi:hypothetical protein